MSEIATEQEPPEEEIEGYDNRSGGYPLDSLFIRQETRSVSEVLGRVKNKRWILNPDYQRDFVWPRDKQSKLIESCIMRIPLPVFYVAEGPDGEIMIVDGLQRITSFLKYVSDEFKIQGAGFNDGRNSESPIEGKKFSQLPLKLQERILDTQLIMYILDADAPERARLDIFERVNSGVALTRQQMRNAIYNGPATRWLKEAAESKLFREATGGSLNSKTMRDREAVNRFCAFSILGAEGYHGDMDEFLAEALRRMNHPGNKEKLDGLRKKFERSLRSNKQLFGKHAFRKSLAEENPYSRTTLNISLFDVCTALLAKYPEEISLESELGHKIQKGLIHLINHSEDFYNAISYFTNNTKAVKTRFELAEKTFGIRS